jgi:large subunit ribosomal protein L6
MIKLKNNNNIKNNQIIFNSFLGNYLIFFIDKKIKISNNIKIKIHNNKNLEIIGPLGKNNLFFFHKLNILLNNNYILFNFNLENKINEKKSILNLYDSLIKLKIKGVLQGFKINLFLNGIGYKFFIENDNLILKLGFSHNITIKIPKNIKIINQTNQIILTSIDWIELTQFVHLIKSYKKTEPYKGKGILLKNEKILRKEGKKSKK